MMNMAPNMAMGGGAPMEQQPQAPQFQPQQFNQQQVMQRAGANNMDQSKAYQAELVNQLRGGTYKDPQGVWGNALNNYDQAQQVKAFQDQQAKAQLAQQQQEASNNNSWYAGDGG
jgi:hypothetical protein